MPPASRLVYSAVIAAMLAPCSASADWTEDRVAPVSRNDLALARETEVVEGRVPNRSTLDDLLRAHQVPAVVSASIVSAVRGVFDPRQLRANSAFRITRTMAGEFRALQCDIDPDRFLSVEARPAADGGAGGFDVAVVPYPREIVSDALSAEISREHSSLTAALDARHENVQLALLLADVFGGEIDFNSDLQRGDRIDTLFERVKRSGAVVGYGGIEAAILHSGSRAITAIRFAGADGKPAWYDELGRSLKRQFLKSPLPFEPRITSGFSASRLHPIYGDVRAHLGVDYGAPAGTSVVAVAAGTVESADWAGDGGRMVVLRHAGGYETLYLHLSAFAPGIHAGVRVSQGDLIGRVGMTGAATGPHLDYRIRKNGAYVNPVAELARMPRGEPIAPSEMDAFGHERDRLLAALNSSLKR